MELTFTLIAENDAARISSKIQQYLLFNKFKYIWWLVQQQLSAARFLRGSSGTLRLTLRSLMVDTLTQTCLVYSTEDMDNEFFKTWRKKCCMSSPKWSISPEYYLSYLITAWNLSFLIFFSINFYHLSGANQNTDLCGEQKLLSYLGKGEKPPHILV